ncbi:MAG: hypothetical protein IKO25_11590 [Clostridia bacterium]|nr:hypothetical protein [Clostridia bacterium]
MEKYFLAPDFDDRFGGDLAHVVVMQNATTELIDRFIEDLMAQQEEEELAPGGAKHLRSADCHLNQKTC